MAEALTTLASQDADSSPTRLAMVASAKEASEKLGLVLTSLNGNLRQHAATTMKAIMQEWLAPDANLELSTNQKNDLDVIVEGIPWKVLQDCQDVDAFLVKSAFIGGAVMCTTQWLQTSHDCVSAWAGFLIVTAAMCDEEAGLATPSMASFAESGATSVGDKIDELQALPAIAPDGEIHDLVNPTQAVIDFSDKWASMALIATETPQVLF
jgi:hypothetical protein